MQRRRDWGPQCATHPRNIINWWCRPNLPWVNADAGQEEEEEVWCLGGAQLLKKNVWRLHIVVDETPLMGMKSTLLSSRRKWRSQLVLKQQQNSRMLTCKERSKELIALRFTKTPTRLLTNIVYTPVDGTSLHSIPSLWCSIVMRWHEVGSWFVPLTSS